MATAAVQAKAESTHVDVLIVGAGISGITAVHNPQASGMDVDVLCRSAAPAPGTSGDQGVGR